MALVLLAGAALFFAPHRQTSKTVEVLAHERAAAAPLERFYFSSGRPQHLDLPGGDRRAVDSVLRITRPMRYGQFVWNDRNVPPGRSWVRVDLGKQILSVFRGGHEVGTGVILYGADSKPTPTGRFTVLARLKDHQSSLYDAEMPYTLRLTNDGVAIHGSNVIKGMATHGCIGIPTAFAAKIFEQVRRGDAVYIVD